MVVCAEEFGADVDELAVAGLTPVGGHRVRANRVAESPCSMGCRVERIIEYPGRAIVFGEVREMFVGDDCLDSAGHYVDPAVYHRIALLHRGNYVV